MVRNKKNIVSESTTNANPVNTEEIVNADAVENTLDETSATESNETGAVFQSDLSVTGKLTFEESVIAVVFPYISTEAQGKELLYAIRSFQQNFKQAHSVVVIGEREDWFDDEKITFIELAQVSDNPQINTMEALKTAIASDKVTESFVWTNDDIYLVAPVDMSHIALPKVLGPLNPEKYDNLYRSNMENTIEFLRSHDLPSLNYGAHMPVLYDKEKLVSLLEEYPEISLGDYLFSSIYFNRYNQTRPFFLNWKTDPFLLPVISKAPDPVIFESLLETKCFLNNTPTGYSAFLESKLEELFPEKSVYEK